MINVREDMTGWIMAEHGFPDSRLTVIKRAEDCIGSDGRQRVQWLCICSCEEHKQILVLQDNLRNGHTLSCGCLQAERVRSKLKKYNKYDLSGDYGIGWTLNTNREFYFDLEDYDKIKDYCWGENFHPNGYCSLEARDPITKKLIKMHALVFSKWCDHKDRNPFNNQKKNLRIANHSENGMNVGVKKNDTSGITGVFWNNQRQKWEGKIKLNYKNIHLGLFNDKNSAIKARLQAEKQYFGEFAPQKHLFEQYGIE